MWRIARRKDWSCYLKDVEGLAYTVAGRGAEGRRSLDGTEGLDVQALL